MPLVVQVSDSAMTDRHTVGRGCLVAQRFKVRPGHVVQAYRFALDPNTTQQTALRSHCGAARVAYNWAVEHVLASWGQRAAEATYGIAESDRTQWRTWNLAALRREWNRVKRADARFEWWAENSKEAYNTGLAAAQAAFANYTTSKRGER
jgi:putative transposase